MCPECLMSAGWILSGAISTGGLSALAREDNLRQDNNRFEDKEKRRWLQR